MLSLDNLFYFHAEIRSLLPIFLNIFELAETLNKLSSFTILSYLTLILIVPLLLFFSIFPSTLVFFINSEVSDFYFYLFIKYFIRKFIIIR